MLSVIAGLIVVRRPGESLLAVVVILGIWFVIDGLLDALRVLTGDPDRGPLLLSAVIDVVLGILILSLPKLSLATLAILVGIGFVVAAWPGFRRLAAAPRAPAARPRARDLLTSSRARARPTAPLLRFLAQTVTSTG